MLDEIYNMYVGRDNWKIIHMYNMYVKHIDKKLNILFRL